LLDSLLQETKMTELVFVKTEYDAVAVKEEYVEKEDPLKITSNSARDGSHEVGDGDQPYSQATETTYQCMGCEYLTKDRNELREHRRTEHGVAVNDQVKMEVEVDPWWTESSNPREIVEAEITKGQISMLENTLYQCGECDFVSANKTNLKQHRKVVKHIGMRYPCDQCEYLTTTASFLKSHKESKHIGIRYLCDKCEYSATTTSHLIRHKQSPHEGKRYFCDQCEYSASDLGNLNQHRKSKHDGVIYSCDQCEYSATTASGLYKHKKSKHDGVRYPCDTCEYTATALSNLKAHTESKHEGLRYPCDQCEFAATMLFSLKRHKLNKH